MSIYHYWVAYEKLIEILIDKFAFMQIKEMSLKRKYA